MDVHKIEKREDRKSEEKRNEEKKHKESVLDREIRVNFKPRGLVKTFGWLVLLAVVFYVGQFTAVMSCTDTSLSDAVGATVAVLSDAEKQIETLQVEKAEGKEEDITSTTTTEVPATQKVAEPKEDVAENSEPIITKYKKVAVAINEVKKDWKGTWGKITQITYTIKNNEAGTIKPAQLVMIVEGYDDFEKKIPLPASSKTLKAGKTVSSTVNVPSGFAYNEITAGNLANVKITVSLLDGDEKEMASFANDFNLNG
jgi:hypothetical protein